MRPSRFSRYLEKVRFSTLRQLHVLKERVGCSNSVAVRERRRKREKRKNRKKEKKKEKKEEEKKERRRRGKKKPKQSFDERRG